MPHIDVFTTSATYDFCAGAGNLSISHYLAFVCSHNFFCLHHRCVYLLCHLLVSTDRIFVSNFVGGNSNNGRIPVQLQSDEDNCDYG